MDGRHAAVKIALASSPANIAFEGALQADPSAALPLVDGVLSVNLPSTSRAAGMGNWLRGGPPAWRQIGAIELDGTVAATEASLKFAASGSVGYKGRAVGFDIDANGGAGWLQDQAFTIARFRPFRWAVRRLVQRAGLGRHDGCKRAGQAAYRRSPWIGGVGRRQRARRPRPVRSKVRTWRPA